MHLRGPANGHTLRCRVHLRHNEATALLEDEITEPEGVSDVLRVLKTHKFRFSSRPLSSHRSIPKAIDSGHIIIGEDCTRYGTEYHRIAHAIVIFGYNAQGYWWVDPMIGLKTLRSREEIRDNCRHLIAVKAQD